MEQSAAAGTSSTAAGGSGNISSSKNSSNISNSGGNNNNNNNNSSTSTVIVQGGSTTSGVSHHQEESISLGSITEIQQQQQQQQQPQQQEQQQQQHQSDQKSFIQLSQHQQQQQQQQHQHQQQHHHQHHHHPHHQHHQHQHQRILLQGTTSSSATPSPVLSPPGKLLGRNTNGTMVSTSTPSNEAELQLYRVLQRASLLAYYDTLLEMGGDDVQQLCDAGEEEFLEIMALVGMASKPLHVRRLQKSLHEWVNNPSSFQTPLPNVDTSRIVYSPDPPIAPRSPFSTSQGYSPSSISGASSTNPNFGNISSISSVISNMPPTATISPNIISTTGSAAAAAAAAAAVAGTSSIQLTPSLSETQLTRVIAAAERLSRDLPQLEPRPQSSKKRSSKELEQVMAMDECDPRRMYEIRKYAAIYGRFDCKRRPEKPLTLHEVCVNEAAAQICKFVPALLTRRDELFPLARQVVRDSGFGHSAGIARYGVGQSFSRSTEQSSDATTNPSSKRMRLSSESTSTDFNKETPEEFRHNLLAIYQKLGKQFDMCSDSTKYTSNYPRSDEYDDTDSRYSFSNSSSPPLQSSNAGDMESNYPDHVDDTTTSSNTATAATTTTTTTPTGTGIGTNTTTIRSPLNDTNNRINSSPLGVHVISSAGGHIIAVANPALALSPALVESLNIKRERMSPDI